MIDDDEGREALAKLLDATWFPPDEGYDRADELMQMLRGAGFRLIGIERHDELVQLGCAVLAIAGAELEGRGKELAWQQLEEALGAAYGFDWHGDALETITALRGGT